MSDSFRGLPGVNPHRRLRTGCLLQALERVPGCAGRTLSLAAWRDMDERKLSLVFLGKVISPIEHAGAWWLQIHGAHNPLVGHRFERWRILQMDSGPH